MQFKRAVWKKGRKLIHGSWYWNWPRQRFVIQLDEPCKITGRTIIVETSGDEPEFNGWKLLPKPALVPISSQKRTVSLNDS